MSKNFLKNRKDWVCHYLLFIYILLNFVSHFIKLKDLFFLQVETSPMCHPENMKYLPANLDKTYLPWMLYQLFNAFPIIEKQVPMSYSLGHVILRSSIMQILPANPSIPYHFVSRFILISNEIYWLCDSFD